MKTYIAPSCKLQNIETAAMLATSLDATNGKTATDTDGGWTRGQEWSAESWSNGTEE